MGINAGDLVRNETTAGTTNMMFSGPTAHPRAFAPHERPPSDPVHSYGVLPRPMVELPRPLEPRPTHHQPSYGPDAPRSQRRPDAFHNPSHSQSEYQPQAQTLPRLHDILTSGPPPQSSYGSNWHSSANPSTNQQNGDGYYSHAPWHPPLAHPPHESAQPYHNQQPRRLELPIIETSPVARHDSHSVPLSPYPGYPEASREYKDPRQERPRQPSASSYHPNGVPSPYTPAGTDEAHYRSPVAALNRPSSDGFGPAGPEFSKKYLGVRDVPGEGTYHCYEDGYRIPTQVDGESVNPAWGLTKANKPRKRLAMACLDCREKKIKCEPGAASCLQCEKAKRPCRKAPTHQSQSELNTSPVWQSSASSPGRKSGNSESTPGRDADPEMVNKRRTMDDDHSPPGVPSKRHRSTSASPLYPINGAVAPPIDRPNLRSSPIIPRSPGKLLSWEEDPYAIEPDMTIHLLDRYFADVNNATYCIFPRHHFMHWLTTSPKKCQNERMVLYAMLAAGSIFAEDRYSGFGKHCATICADAIRHSLGRFSLSVVQSRLLLGLHHFAKGGNSLGWDYIGSAINAAKYLRYNTEPGCAEEDGVETARNEFAFSTEQIVECKRRTLWSGFLMDRYCGATQSIINPEDIVLRLPCSDETYERGLASNAPYYNNGIIDPVKAVLTASSAISPMGWLILVAVIWGDVVNFIYRAVNRSPMVYEEEYEKFHKATGTALKSWASCLPEQLRFNQANVELSIQGGYAGPFVSMHVLYHLSWLKMSRFVRHEYISKSIARNVQATHRHAHELLQVMSTLRVAKWEVVDREGHSSAFSFTTPFAGYAVLAAIDVVGAGGLDSNLKSTLELISCGLECLRELGQYWDSAKDQDKACEKRYYQIQNVMKHPFTARSGCWLGREWGVHSSLEREFASEDDCIYGVSDRDYFDALKDGTVHGRGPHGGVRAV